MDIRAVVNTLLTTQAQDWSPEDRELFPELVIALFSLLADQARRHDVTEELLDLRAAARGLGSAAHMPGHALLSLVLLRVVGNAMRFLTRD